MDMVYDALRLDDEYLVTVRGAFDGAIAPVAYGDIIAALDAGAREVVVDLGAATEVDDGALAVLAAIAVAALGGGGHLFVALGADRLIEITDASLVRSVFDH
jgi:anti-anti-sigma regulatory factor